MNSAASDYLQLAKECIQEAESAQDEDRKRTLLSIAKLYNQTALSLEGGSAPPADLANPIGRGHSVGGLVVCLRSARDLADGCYGPKPKC
jgi:hypothetical protein